MAIVLSNNPSLKLMAFQGVELDKLHSYLDAHRVSVRRLAENAGINHTTAHRAMQGKTITAKNFARVQYVVDNHKPFYAGDVPEPLPKLPIPKARELAVRIAALEAQATALQASTARIEKILSRMVAVFDRIEIEGLGELKPSPMKQAEEPAQN